MQKRHNALMDPDWTKKHVIHILFDTWTDYLSSYNNSEEIAKQKSVISH